MASRRTHRASYALARLALRAGRARTIGFAALFAVYAYVQPVGYRHTYPTLAGRLAFAHSFAGNQGLRFFYGEPRDLPTVGGYTAWRVGGTLAIVAAVFGLLAAIGALRAEEDAGRMEVVLAGLVGRRAAFLAPLAAIGAGVATLWLAETVGLVLGGLPATGSAFLGLATASVAAVFAGVGALVSQLAPTRRIARELGGAVVGAFLLLRVVADTSPGLGGLRFLTPLGWAEDIRPLTGAHPAVLLLPLAATALLIVAALRIAVRRDVGSALLRPRDSAAPRLLLLSSPAAQSLRSEWASLAGWTGGVAAFALVLGLVSGSVSSAGISKTVVHEIQKLGSASILTPAGYVAFVFVFFVLALSLFACSQIAAARSEEASERLETLLALPVDRRRWLGGRLLLASCAAAVLALAAAFFTWAGAALDGVSLSLPQMLEAGANCLPVALLFLGVAAMAYAVAPRPSGGIAYGLVTVSFLWQLVGALLGAPDWVVGLTPFAHVGLVPVQAIRWAAAAAMTAIGAGAALAALGLLRRRDLSGA